MAYMTENTNLQRALLRTIAEAGEGKVEIREHSKVQEMKMDEGKRSVTLKLGEQGWVRGGVVVSRIRLIHRSVSRTDFTLCFAS
jgi:ubiquinone biosynthesis monooxygenase Coq6